MSVILGSGEHRYRVIENWAQLPPGRNFKDYLNINPGKSAPEYLRSLQKLERVT
jgi:hypothetical protein